MVRARPIPEAAPHDKRRRGRPALGPDDVAARVEAYCSRYAVRPDSKGLPPYPSGRRETRQHREWMALYKALRRLEARRGGVAGPPAQASFGPASDRLMELLAAQRGRCPVCRETLTSQDARLEHEGSAGPAVLHPQCSELVTLVRRLGAAAVERARARAFP